MRIFLILGVVAMSLLISCKFNNSAIAFSDKIVQMEDALEKPMEQTEMMVDSMATADNYAAMVKPASDMEAQVQAKIDELKKLEPAGKGGDDFKKAAVEYFEYIKSVYTKYKEIGLAKTDAERTAVAQAIGNIDQQKSAAVSKIQAAQQNFAAQNGIEVK